jgi:hypothetical protein
LAVRGDPLERLGGQDWASGGDQLIADTASQTATSSDGDRQQNPQVLCRPCIWLAMAQQEMRRWC